jgi:sialate O-acetylesterase
VAGKNTLSVRDVLVGEVWICGGQSNMEVGVKTSLNAAQEIAQADDPYMRLFTVEKAVAGKPQLEAGGQWVAARPQTVPDFSAVGYYFARELRKTLNVPVGLINNAWGGTTAEAWTSRETLESDPVFRGILDREKEWLATAPALLDDFQQRFNHWKEAADQADREGNPIPPAPRFPREPRGDAWRRASGLFNAMLMPLTNYSIAGVIWYQGEANVMWPDGEGTSVRPIQYRKLFPALIHDWRRAWQQGEFPFLYVQLSYYVTGVPQYDFNWSLLQESQLKTLAVRKTAMAVSIDLPELPELHPKNKQEIAHRLALAAQAIAYGRDIPYSGPIYNSMSIEGGRIRVRFQHGEGLRTRNGGDEAPLWFEIAGSDHHFQRAQAKIEADTVVVGSPWVPTPVAVRYCFSWMSRCNLYNQAGLPASPFRTDEWPEAGAVH